MSTVLFIVNPLPSHYNCCWSLADYLREQGFRVVFTGMPYLQEHVERQGFAFIELDYLIEYYVVDRRQALADLRQSLTNKSFAQSRKAEFAEKVQSIDDVCARVRPDYILIDEHISHYYFLTQHHARQTYFVHIKPPMRQAPGIPPITVAQPVRDTLPDRLRSWALWQQHHLRRSAGRLLRSAVFVGKNDMYFVGQHALRYGLDRRRQLRKAHALFDFVKGVRSIYLVPPQLEYPWFRPSADEWFFRRPYQRQDVADTSVIMDELAPILCQRAAGRTKLLYVSLGTLSADQADAAIAFLHQVLAAVRGLTGVHVVIASGLLSENRDVVASLPPHVRLLAFVPQVQLLPHCDLMLTHGGSNSVFECLAAGVPMLVYPLNLTSDQPGYAARVVYHGLGLAGELRRARPLELQQQINHLLADPTYAERVRAMQQRIEADLPAQEAAIRPLFGLPAAVEVETAALEAT